MRRHAVWLAGAAILLGGCTPAKPTRVRVESEMHACGKQNPGVGSDELPAHCSRHEGKLEWPVIGDPEDVPDTVIPLTEARRVVTVFRRLWFAEVVPDGNESVRVLAPCMRADEHFIVRRVSAGYATRTSSEALSTSPSSLLYGSADRKTEALSSGRRAPPPEANSA
ncbi:MAG: hypothetical protein JRI23_27340 [Deltaproteobacteria bacterium]|nr:hypothetical protein [Deltaproteobacteria bacterium]MBW2535794.1 hypothetical protein [Deltaproteobacteria bacterium]